jgi:hypothetical protein
MTSFLHEFDALIRRHWENPAGFCRASGMTSAYMSEIFGPKKKLPAVPGMAKYLEKAGVSEHESDIIIYALSMDKAKKNPNFTDLIRILEHRDKERATLSRRLLDLCIQMGAKVPDDLVARVHAL